MDVATEKSNHIILHLEMNLILVGKAVSDWTCNYNNSHGSITRNGLHNELMCLFT